MENALLFGIISTGIGLIGIISLWRDILKWRTIPHFFSHFVWLVLVGFNLFVLISNREFIAMVPAIFMTTSLFFCCIFWFWWLRRISINWFDYLCLILSILLILYWIFSWNTLNAVILTVIIDLIAFLPTFKKWWIQPWTETTLVYFMSSLGQIFTLLSLSGFENLENMIFWFYLFFANLIFTCMVLYRRYSLKWWKSVFE